MGVIKNSFSHHVVCLMNMNLLCSREPLRVCEVVVVQNHKVIKEERKKGKKGNFIHKVFNDAAEHC